MSVLSCITARARGRLGGFSYRLCLPHVYSRADRRRVAFASAVHLLHHALHLASGETVEKHRCRRREQITRASLRSASQDFRETQTQPHESEVQMIFFNRKKMAK